LVSATGSNGSSRKTVDIAVVGDAAFEEYETFTVTLSAPVAATIADGAATGTITNDDQPPARVGAFSGQISGRDFSGHEFINSPPSPTARRSAL
jgi:hypothetical protein